MENPTCEICGGTGVINEDEQVYPNEPHYASTGTIKCSCRTIEADGDGEND